MNSLTSVSSTGLTYSKGTIRQFRKKLKQLKRFRFKTFLDLALKARGRAFLTAKKALKYEWTFLYLPSKMDKEEGKLLPKASIKIAKCMCSLWFIYTQDKKELVEANRTVSKSK